MRILKILIAGLFVLSPLMASADLITSVNVRVGDTDLIATFNYLEGRNSFNALWDGNGNGDLLDDGALDPFDFLPYFWDDLDGAIDAADQIIAALGPSDWLNEVGTVSDAFVIPVELSEFFIWRVGDFQSQLTADWNRPGVNQLKNTFLSSRTVYVTFKERTVSVPEPGTLALLGIGLVGIAAMRRRKAA